VSGARNPLDLRHRRQQLGQEMRLVGMAAVTATRLGVDQLLAAPLIVPRRQRGLTQVLGRRVECEVEVLASEVGRFATAGANAVADLHAPGLAGETQELAPRQTRITLAEAHADRPSARQIRMAGQRPGSIEGRLGDCRWPGRVEPPSNRRDQDVELAVAVARGRTPTLASRRDCHAAKVGRGRDRPGQDANLYRSGLNDLL
jgi:hypothetical protein